MASEHNKRVGEYTTDKKDKDERQKHLHKWTEEWQTKDGSGDAKQEDGADARYLPKKAWNKITEEEKNETDKKKLEAGKEGQQYVSNTAEAKEARRESEAERGSEAPNAEQHDTPYMERDEGEEQPEEQETEMEQTPREQQREDSVHRESASEEAENTIEGQDANTTVGKSESEEKEGTDAETLKQDDQGKTAANTKKRARGANQKGASKKQKLVSNMDEGPKGMAGDKTRIPQMGQQVQWRTLQGYVDGEVVEVAYDEKTVDGKTVKASKDDPRVILKSATSGKIAVHKPEAVYFS